LFWFYSAALLIVAALFVLVPLWRFHRRGGADAVQRERTNLLIFQERLAELEAERAAGTMEEENFIALRLELERSLLADVDATATQPAAQARTSWLSPSRLLPLLMVLLTIPTSLVLYQQWGYHEELALADLFERTQLAETPEESRDLIYALGDQIEEHGDNGWLWYFMAQNLIKVGQFPEVPMFLDRAAGLIEQPQDKSMILGQQAFIEYLLAGQQVTDTVQGLVEQTQLLDANQYLVMQILATEAQKQDDYQGAITYWRRMLQQVPTGPEADALREAIAMAQATLADAGAGAGSDGAVSGPVINVAVSLAEGIELPPQTRVFVSALDVNGRGQPLAAQLLTVADLPVTVTLSDRDAVGAFNLSSAESVFVVATASVSGTANVQSGDRQGRSEGFDPGEGHTDIQVVIADLVP